MEELIVSMIAAGEVTSRLDDKGLIEKAESAETQEAKITAVEEGIVVIKETLKEMFKPNETAQELRKKVEAEMIEHHYQYFGVEAI